MLHISTTHDAADRLQTRFSSLSLHARMSFIMAFLLNMRPRACVNVALDNYYGERECSGVIIAPDKCVCRDMCA